MPTGRLLCVLVCGIVVMCGIITLQMKWYRVALWKCIVIAVTLTLVGVTGSYVWYFIENLSWGGRSFYGAIFFAPPLFIGIAKIFHIPYLYSLDFCAPAGCVTLALVKIDCLFSGCCVGKILYLNDQYVYVRFPSRLAETLNFLIIAVVLLLLSKKQQFRGYIFQVFLILYGITRFALNFMREDQSVYVLGMAAGTFWSVCAFIVGIIWLILLKQKEKKQKEKESHLAEISE